MALYTSTACPPGFGDWHCASCADLHPAGEEAGTTAITPADQTIVAPGACESRWWLWLVLGLVLGYAASGKES